MTLYYVRTNNLRGFHEAETEAAAADMFARAAGYAGAGDMIEDLDRPITVEPAEAAATEALLSIEETIGNALLDQIVGLARSVENLREAVTNMGELLSNAAASRTNGRGQ